MSEEKNNVTKIIPNQAYDCEYMTEWKREVSFLKEHGIEPTFVKYANKYNIKMYKYTKTPELFRLLTLFYEQVKQERAYNILEQQLSESSVNDVPEEVKQTVANYILLPDKNIHLGRGES